MVVLLVPEPPGILRFLEAGPFIISATVGASAPIRGKADGGPYCIG